MTPYEKVVMPWRLFGSRRTTLIRLVNALAREMYVLMVMPAALVGPVISSTLSLSESPGESIASASTELAFAARM